MLRSYWKIAWRNIGSHKTFTLINISGLALGICFCLVIFLVADFEFSFDTARVDKDRIYHLGYHMSVGAGADESWNVSRVMPALPEAIKKDLTGVEATAGFYEFWQPIIKVADKTYPQPERGAWSETLIATPGYFSIFQYKWLAGNPASFDRPFQIVLTESRAKQYFGNMPATSIIGKQLTGDDSIHLTVSGIVEEYKGNTDFRTSAIVSFSTIGASGLKNRFSTNDWAAVRGKPEIWAFVKLNKGTNLKQFNTRLDQLVKKNTPAGRDVLGILMQPLKDVHFDNSYSHDDIRNAHKPTLYGIIAIAIFILLLAVINFINLSTAQSIGRAKEVGIRKVLGSKRTTLTAQFLIETFHVVILAVVLAAALVNPVLHIFHDFIPEGVSFSLNLSLLLFFVTITVVTTILAGFYPARILSSYLPVVTLKGNAAYQGNQGWSLRRGLIVLQFTISLIFILCTLIVSQQVQFMLKTDYGFKTNAVISVGTNWRDSLRKVQILQNKLSQLPGIENVVRESGPPIGWNHWYMPFTFKGKTEIRTGETAAGDESFLDFYHMRLVAGRNLMRSDSMREVLVNETAVRSFGFTSPGQAVGRFLFLKTDGGERSFPIVGVVADYHTESFRSVIPSLVIAHWAQQEIMLGIRLKSTADIKKTLASVEAAHKEIYPNDDFNYSFMDESIRNLYEEEQKTTLLVRSAMLITIFISCIGLFGVALFSAAKRTREIGIRKVLGASIANIVLLLTREFVLLVALAIFIAAPIAWWGMHNWLNNFAYRSTIGLPLFLLAGFAGIAIAIFTVGFQALRAARANPVKSLRAN